MIVILAANVRILARGFAGTIPQRQAKAQFLIRLALHLRLRWVHKKRSGWAT